MAKKKDEITIRSSAAEYLTYVASVGDQQDSIRRGVDKLKNIDSELFRRFGFEARLLKKLGFLIWKHIRCKMCVRL